ncbi:MAG: lamin tail domain-containing protein, partial [Candidatus Pacebacteria bacterium]|nr:lamin tail domain-containing protein [Candidatus Paceibacterota bacterium]
MKISLPSRSGENKKTFFILQSVALLLFFLVAGFITCHKSSADDAPDSLIISEVLVGGNSASEEFIELYNPSESEIDLEKMPLALHIVNSKNSDSAKDLNFINGTIGAKSYYLIASKDYASDSDNKTDPDVTYSASLVADGAV